MADYRDWCYSCQNEINFGGHKPNCEAMLKERDAVRQLRDFNSALYDEYSLKTRDGIVDEAIILSNEIEALGSLLHGKEKKWKFLRYELMRGDTLELFRERTGKRYV